MRVLILGGYGTFGGRLVRLLADEARLTLIVAGRSMAKAETFVETVDANATLIPAVMDRDGDLGAAFDTHQPDVLVDASGPFQAYGEAPYRVAEAAMKMGAGYLDLADGTEFVTGIVALDAEARQHGTFAISGASTFPALSSAVLRRLAEGWQRVDHIECGLAPSPKAGLGGNVIRAILAYAGKTVPLRRDGKLMHGVALIESCRRTVAPPGILPLPNLRYVLVDVPDLRLMADEWPGLRSVWAGVATRPQFLLRILSACAGLVRLRLLKSLLPLSRLAEWTMQRFQRGEHRGGLFVEIAGTDENGNPATRGWHMIAEGDDGPSIPSMAAEALIRRALEGSPPRPGAHAATRVLELDTFEAAFAKRRIWSGVRDDEGDPLYRRMLGEAWARLPAPIREMHAAPDGLTASGTATVERGSNPLAKLVGAIVGFPRAGAGVPVEVRFTVDYNGELWERSFAGKRFSSIQREGTGRFAGLLSERFGPLEFGLALVVEDDRLKLVTRGWRAFGVPMPRFLAPGGDAFEHVVDGVFNFHVEITHPLTGLIVRYRGALKPQDSA